VVGVPRRSIAVAVVLDTAAVLGAAAVAGIAAGALSQYVVVHTLTLGYVDNIFTPRVLSSLDVRSVVELLAAACAVMVCIAAVLGGLIVRGARSATLRENA
jgi:putative ABC transport system permease protein